MRILQLSSTDLIGKRFNGQYLTEELPSYGHQATHLVWFKEGANQNTHIMVPPYPLRRFLQKASARLEDHLSIRSVLHPSSALVKYNSYFRAADVVHYQIMHWPDFFSWLALPQLTHAKPSVLTIHDFWAFTGHCVHPFDCLRWQSGCGQCPYLHTDFSMRRDHTKFMWKLKNNVYKRSKLNIVVASKFMHDIVQKSPMLNRFNIHYVPFGLDLNKYKPGNQLHSKRVLGIEPDEIVIALRSSRMEFKGLKYVKEALRAIKTDKKICLLTFDERWNMEEFRTRFKIVDLGWVNDEDLMLAAFDAADFFLMPSIQESFGMMAVEAMAFGKPVVVFEGTSLPDVIGGNKNGFVVKSRDSVGLATVISSFISDPSLLKEKGQNSLKYTQDNYSLEKHIRGLIRVYEEAIRSH